MNACHLTRVVLLAVWLPGLVAPVTGQDRPVAALLETPATQADLQLETPSDMSSGTRSLQLRGVKVELRGSGDFLAGEAVRVVRDQLALAGDMSVSAPLADDLAFFVRGRYLQGGYARARVDWAVRGDVIVLTVDEGMRLMLGPIVLTGVDELLWDELAGYLVRPTRERSGLLVRKLPFVEADVVAGTGLVVRRLQAAGYLQAAAAAPIVEMDESSGLVAVTLALMPGPVSVFGQVALTGETAVVTPLWQRQAAALQGQPFNEVSLEALRAGLNGGLQQLGYFAARVESEIDPAVPAPGPAIPAVGGEPAGTTVAVTLRVTAGRRFEVRDIQVGTGLGRGATRVARSIFAAASSQRFAPETIDLLHRRALDTGIFSRLDVEPVVIGDGALALRVAGAEARPRLLGLYGGYETFLGPILGAEVRHVNFMDTGDALAARAEFRGVGHEGSVQWSDPAWWGSSWALATGLSYETFTFHDYDRETAAWQSALTRRLTRRITAEAFTAVSYNLVNSSVLTAGELGPDEYSSASGGLRLTLDYRDNPVSVRRGWLVGVSVESGVIDGNDTATTSFLQGSFNGAWYQPLGTRWRFALGTHASAITASETDSAIPLDLRNFNGGATSVRSFAERELGPVSAAGDTPLGGLASGVVSAELSWEAWRNLEVAAFVDAGTTGAEASSIFTAEDLRYGIGLGLRYRLPVGPLRVDYGVNPDRRDGEAAGALHVTFGFAF